MVGRNLSSTGIGGSNSSQLDERVACTEGANGGRTLLSIVRVNGYDSKCVWVCQ